MHHLNASTAPGALLALVGPNDASRPIPIIAVLDKRLFDLHPIALIGREPRDPKHVNTTALTQAIQGQ